jgi:phage baseplate assembly protein W
MAKAINIKFPLEDDVEKNILFKQNFVSKDALVSNLLLLLLTEEGERFYMSDYGINLKKYLFEMKDGITENEITEEIRQRVKTFIPQLTITKVQFFSSDVDEDGAPLMDNEITVLVNFVYDNNTFSEQGSVEITFPA